MTDQYDVLVVCVGNLCRSPLAERLLRLRLVDSPDVRVTSAGTHAVVGAPMDALAADELERLGGDPTDFTARHLTPDLVTSADLVLTATRRLRGQVVGVAPSALKRTFTLPEFAALLARRPWEGTETDRAALVARAADWRDSVNGLGDDLDVPDPIGRSPKVHRTVAVRVDRATRAIAAWLT